MTSKSFANLRFRPIQAKNCSTTQCHGLATKALESRRSRRFNPFQIGLLYQIALPAIHLLHYGKFVTVTEKFDLTHVYDAISRAQHRAI